jgi:hypothetical protein
MTQLVEATIDNGSVLFEVADATTAGPQKVARHGGNTVATLDQSLDAALASVRPAAEKVLHTFTGLGLDTCQIEFGVSLDAQAGAIIAKTGASAHFTITLAWTHQPPTLNHTDPTQ